MFRGREMHHIQLGEKILRRMAGVLSDVATVEQETKVEGRNMVMVLGPK
ncbi:MAG: translation initiation factor IF-3 C-terminal domain-containing protein [bacterium]